MAKSELKSITDLAALHRNRPSFARMVSWEFGRQDYNRPATKKKEARSADYEDKEVEVSESNLDDFTDSESTDDSEYYSAEELSYVREESDHMTPVFINENESILTNERTAKLSISSDDNETYTTSIQDVKFENPSVVDIPFKSKSMKARKSENDVKSKNQVVHERRRRPSKKQRKAHRRRFKVEYLDHALPFHNAENLGIELPYENVHENFTEVNKYIPSLAEFCMKRIHGNPKQELKASISVLPQRLWEKGRERYSLRTLQLSWLHRTLTLHNTNYSSEEHSPNFLKQMQGPNKEKVPLRPLRSVWFLHLNSELDPHQQVTFDGRRAQQILLTLPDTFVNPHEINAENNHMAWSHLSHCIDLMLPQCMPCNVQRNKLKEEDVNDHLTTSIVHVKRALESRYPCLVKYLFEECLPYVLWARGLVKKAAELFLSLSERSTAVSEAYKGVYLNEAGRMYAQFGENAMATSMFMKSAELQAQYQGDSYKQTVSGQAMMLVANLTDTGVFSPDKAKSALAVWEAVLKLYKIPDYAEEAALISLMCFHAGQYTVGDWLGVCEEKIIMWSTRVPHLLLYLSLVHALKGFETESIIAFGDFVNKNTIYDIDTLPGFINNIHGNGRLKRKTPWQPLVNEVKVRGQIPLIQVLWRTQLCHPVFTRQPQGGGFVTDNVDGQPHLRLTPEDLLTGNLRMLLPPLKTVCLDPFTGSLVFPSIPLNSDLMYAVATPERPSSPVPDHILLPVRRRVFESSSGQLVDMLIASELVFDSSWQMDRCWYRGGAQVLSLFWYCSVTNETVKLDLRKNIRQKLKADIKSTILRDYEKGQPDCNKMLETLETFFNLGFQLSYGAISSSVKDQLRFEKKAASLLKENKSRKAKKAEVKSQQNRKKPLYIRPLTLKISQCAQFGNSLVFVLQHSDLTHWKCENVVVMVNCATQDAFLDPVILTDGLSLIQPLPNSAPCAKKGEIILLHKTTEITRQETEKGFLCYDDKLNLLKHLAYPNGYTEGDFLVHGKHQYGVHESKTRLVLDCLTDSLDGPVLYTDISSVHSAGHHLLISDERGVSFANKDTLEPLSIVAPPQCPLEIVNDDSFFLLKGPYHTVSILLEKARQSETGEVIRVAIGLNSYLVIIEMSERVTITTAVELPGIPREAHFISQQDGFLVTTSVHSGQFCYFENLYHLNYKGHIVGILPCLGTGPRGFFSFYYHGNKEMGAASGAKNKSQVTPGWYVYMKDGHAGLICLKLQQL